MAHARPFWASKLQDLSNGIKNTPMQGVLTPELELWIFGSPGGLQVPTFGNVSFILTLNPKWGCDKCGLFTRVPLSLCVWIWDWWRLMTWCKAKWCCNWVFSVVTRIQILDPICGSCTKCCLGIFPFLLFLLPSLRSPILGKTQALSWWWCWWCTTH